MERVTDLRELPVIQQNSIMLVDWSASSEMLGFSFCGRQPGTVGRWRARGPHTHSGFPTNHDVFEGLCEVGDQTKVKEIR